MALEKEKEVKASGIGSGPLALARVAESDADGSITIFETNRLVTFTFTRNVQKSPSLGATFGQDIEPTGLYMIHKEHAAPEPRGWQKGTMTFRKPLVLEATLDRDLYGPKGWKARLVRESGGKKGRALSQHLIAMGHDGIVTVTMMGGFAGTGEIVALKS